MVQVRAETNALEPGETQRCLSRTRDAFSVNQCKLRRLRAGRFSAHFAPHLLYVRLRARKPSARCRKSRQLPLGFPGAQSAQAHLASKSRLQPTLRTRGTKDPLQCSPIRPRTRCLLQRPWQVEPAGSVRLCGSPIGTRFHETTGFSVAPLNAGILRPATVACQVTVRSAGSVVGQHHSINSPAGIT